MILNLEVSDDQSLCAFHYLRLAMGWDRLLNSGMPNSGSKIVVELIMSVYQDRSGGGSLFLVI